MNYDARFDYVKRHRDFIKTMSEESDAATVQISSRGMSISVPWRSIDDCVVAHIENIEEQFNRLKEVENDDK